MVPSTVPESGPEPTPGALCVMVNLKVVGVTTTPFTDVVVALTEPALALDCGGVPLRVTVLLLTPAKDSVRESVPVVYVTLFVPLPEQATQVKAPVVEKVTLAALAGEAIARASAEPKIPAHRLL